MKLLPLPTARFAHEAYVLTHSQFQQGQGSVTHNPFGALFQGHNLTTFLFLSLAVATSYVLAVLWSTTKPAAVIDKAVRKLAVIGPLIIRLAISASFLFAAESNSFLGPELSLGAVRGGSVIRYILFLLAIMIFTGFLTELAAAVGLVIMSYVALHFGSYLITYANYAGELLVLLLFGSRFLSIDLWLFGKKTHWPKLEPYRWCEVSIVRILYGLALLYAAYSVKLLHQSLTITVYNEYHLVRYFHLPAMMVAAGAGLAELLIGLFVILGLALRWTLILSLVFITLSLLYFHEMLWPHLMLYGISLSLIINSSDRLTIDRYMVPWATKLRRRLIGR